MTADESVVEGDLKGYLESLTKMSSERARNKVAQDTGKDAFIKADWLPDYFYQKLIDEINRLYRSKLPVALATLIRKLLENLIIDILRRRYGNSGIGLYYNTSKERFLDFSTLVKNLDSKKADFQHITQNLGMAITDINHFKEAGNRSAHSIDVQITIDDFAKDRERINHLVQLLLRIIQNIEAERG